MLCEAITFDHFSKELPEMLINICFDFLTSTVPQ